jgi:hypothetical protein
MAALPVPYQAEAADTGRARRLCWDRCWVGGADGDQLDANSDIASLIRSPHRQRSAAQMAQ